MPTWVKFVVKDHCCCQFPVFLASSFGTAYSFMKKWGGQISRSKC